MSQPVRGQSRRRRDHYAWWEYTLMVFTVLLIVAGAALLIRLVTAPPAPAPAPVDAGPTSIVADCPTNGWFDAKKGSCVPKVECTAEQVYDQKTNECGAPPPLITGISPHEGPSAGGTELTITGSGFVEGAEVMINGQRGIDTRVINKTTIATTTPASSVYYPVDIVVTNADGQTDKVDNGYTFVAPPVQNITEIVPADGSTDGGEAVIIKGQNFLDGAVVSFYGRPATDVVVLDPNTIRATIPAAPAGAVTVNVRNPGMDAYVLDGGFTYVNRPPRVVMAIRPAEGSLAGGTEVTIAGTGFVKGADVLIGGRKATQVKVVSDTTITAITPKGALGLVDVGVRNPGLPVALLAQGYSYVEAPTIASIAPAEGPATGGAKVTITGSGFLDGATVTFGPTAAAKVTVVDDTTIEVTAPPAKDATATAPAIVDVTVTNTGQPAAVLKQAFTYTPVAPVVPVCKPIKLPPRTAPAGQDLSLTAADLFPAARGLTSPKITDASVAGEGIVQWQASPGAITWTAPTTPGVTSTITFHYTAANCTGTATGTILVGSG